MFKKVFFILLFIGVWGLVLQEFFFSQEKKEFSFFKVHEVLKISFEKKEKVFEFLKDHEIWRSPFEEYKISSVEFENFLETFSYLKIVNQNMNESADCFKELFKVNVDLMQKESVEFFLGLEYKDLPQKKQNYYICAILDSKYSLLESPVPLNMLDLYIMFEDKMPFLFQGEPSEMVFVENEVSWKFMKENNEWLLKEPFLWRASSKNIYMFLEDLKSKRAIKQVWEKDKLHLIDFFKKEQNPFSMVFYEKEDKVIARFQLSDTYVDNGNHHYILSSSDAKNLLASHLHLLDMFLWTNEDAHRIVSLKVKNKVYLASGENWYEEGKNQEAKSLPMQEFADMLFLTPTLKMYQHEAELLMPKNDIEMIFENKKEIFSLYESRSKSFECFGKISSHPHLLFELDPHLCVYFYQL